MARQFVACTFQPGEGRSYTFHNDGEPLNVGDRVRTESGAAVHVASIIDDEPDFPTKGIVGLAPAKDPTE